MKKYILFIFAAFLIFSACSKDVSNVEDRGNSTISINILIPEADPAGFNKPEEITAVRLTVSASGMTDIVKNLTLSSGEASGTVSVPKRVKQDFFS